MSWEIEKIALSETNAFQKIFLDYIDQNIELEEFYNFQPRPESIKMQASLKKFSNIKRAVLYKAILNQYGKKITHKEVRGNIERLTAENAYTITTGHQLNLCGGPLYFIYKIITVLNTCEVLKNKYPSTDFIPVFWMASEDHDFEEINHFNFFGRKIEWKTKQTGAVGRFKTKGIAEVLKAEKDIPEEIIAIYESNATLAEATRAFVDYLFGEYGIVVIDADDKNLKTEFKDYLAKETSEWFSSTMVEKTSAKLKKKGYKPQASTREINLFYLENNIRARVEKHRESYKIVGTPVDFSKEELRDVVNNYPEKFSPNVVLRPLYQETILPNVAYVGGPSEIAYWLQLKDLFDEAKMEFPVLIPRNSVMIFNKNQAAKMKKFGIPASFLFKDEKEIARALVESEGNGYKNIDFAYKNLKTLEDKISKLAGEIDPTLEDLVGSEFKQFAKLIDKLDKKFQKTEENKFAQKVQQIQNIKSKIVSEDNLQERTENVLTFLVSDKDFISKLKNVLDPFDFDMTLINYVE